MLDQATGESTGELPERSHIKTYRRATGPGHNPRKSVNNAKSNSKSSDSSTNTGTDTSTSTSRSLSPATSTPQFQITSPAAFRQQFFSQFLATFVPDVHQAVSSLKDDPAETTWLVLLPEMPELTKALDTALLALSTARVGRNNKDDRLVRESRKLYGEGLVHLQRALWNPKLMYRDETLAACMALGVYEYVLSLNT